MKDRKVAELEVIHDLIALVFRSLRTVLREIAHESQAVTVVDLPEDIIQVMPRIHRYGRLRFRQLRKLMAFIRIIGIRKWI